MKTLHLSIIAIFALSPLASAITPTVLKLHTPSGSAGGNFAWSMTGSEKWLLVGEVGNGVNVIGSGAVDVYDPKTGKLLRQLFASDGANGDDFGSSVAVSGNLAVIGAYAGDGNKPGAAYVFDLSKGKQLFKLTPSDGVNGDVFGYAVAVHGTRAIISAVNHNTQRGAVYVFDITSGSELLKIEADDAADVDQFGYSVALSGNLALIGAPGVDDPVSNAGALYVYDIRSGTKLHRLLATSPQSRLEAHLGTSAAISGHHGLSGSPQYHSKRGSVHVFDLRTGAEAHTLQAEDAATSSEFGSSLAVQGQTVLIGSEADDGAFSNEGSAYLFDLASGSQVQKINVMDAHINQRLGKVVAFAGSSLAVGSTGISDDASTKGGCYLFTGYSAPLPLTITAKKNDYVTDIGDVVFSSFGSFQINADGEALIQSKLSGPGASGGKSGLLHSTLSGTHDQVMRTGGSFWQDDGEQIISIGSPQLEHTGSAVFQMTMKGQLSGQPITSTNDVVLMRENGADSIQLLREGGTLNAGGFTGQTLKSFTAQACSTTDEQVAITVSLNAASTEDSAVILHNVSTNTIADSTREGAASPFAFIDYGHIASRVGMTGSDAIVTAALTGDATKNAAVVKLGVSGPDLAVARKGDAAPGTTGFFSSFLGESANALNQPIIRATLSGVASSMNEGLWANRGASLGLVAQKGAQVNGLDTGVLFSSFIRAWMLPTDRVLLLAKLKGTGVKSSNDQCLFLALPDGSHHVMMREGDYAPGGEGTKIGSFSQIDVDVVNATYAIIASLTGGASSSNQALFVGDADIDPAPGHEEILRPRMLLRKGSYQGLFGSTASLSSMKMLLPNESTGVGGRGLGGAIAGNRVALQLSFSNKSVMIGTLE